MSLSPHSRRSREDRVYLRFPALVRIGVRAAQRLPPRSRARRAVIHRVAHSGFEAVNRGDFDLAFLLCDPEIEFVTPPSLAGLGFEPVFRGLQARYDFQRRWSADWGDMRFEPDELLDLGDRLLFVGHVKGAGASSGAAFESEWAVLYTLSAGRLVREQPFFDRAEALAAAGLAE